MHSIVIQIFLYISKWSTWWVQLPFVTLQRYCIIIDYIYILVHSIAVIHIFHSGIFVPLNMHHLFIAFPYLIPLKQPCLFSVFIILFLLLFFLWPCHTVCSLRDLSSPTSRWIPVFPGGPVVKNPPASTGDAKDSSSIGLGRSPGVGNGNPLQCSCLENSMDRGVWWAIVNGIANRRDWAHACTHTAVLKAPSPNP